jgi:hypothetical protein
MSRARGSGITRRGNPQPATVGHSPGEDLTERVMPVLSEVTGNCVSARVTDRGPTEAGMIKFLGEGEKEKEGARGLIVFHAVFRRQPCELGPGESPPPKGWLHTLGFGLPPKSGVIDDRARVRERLLPSVPVRLPLFSSSCSGSSRDDGDHFPRTTATATIAALARADHDADVYGKRSAMLAARTIAATGRDHSSLQECEMRKKKTGPGKPGPVDRVLRKYRAGSHSRDGSDVAFTHRPGWKAPESRDPAPFPSHKRRTLSRAGDRTGPRSFPPGGATLQRR